MSTAKETDAHEASYWSARAAEAVEVESTLSVIDRAECASLTLSYGRAQKRFVADDTDYNNDAADVAWDALVDWIEAHDLNYSSLDPRGAVEEDRA